MSRQSRPEAQRGLGVRLSVALGLLTAMGPVGTDLQLPGLPDLADALHTSTSLASATIPVYTIGLAVGQLVMGPLSDRLGRRRPMLVCVTLFAVTGVLSAIAPSIWFLLAVRVVQGFLGGGCAVIARTSVRDRAVGARAAKIQSQISLVFILAPVLAPIIGGQVLRFTDWRGLFWTFTAIAVVQMLVALAWFGESHPEQHRSESVLKALAGLGGVFRLPAFRQHMVMAMCQGTVLYMYISQGSTVLRHSYDVGPQAFSAIFAVNAVGIALGNMVNARFVHRFGPLNMLTGSVWGYSVTSVLLLATLLAHAPLWAVGGALFLVLFTYGPATANNMALALHSLGHVAGAATAVLGATLSLFGAATALVIPFVFGTSGLVMAGVMALAGLVGVVQIMTVLRPSHAAHGRQA